MSDKRIKLVKGDLSDVKVQSSEIVDLDHVVNKEYVDQEISGALITALADAQASEMTFMGELSDLSASNIESMDFANGDVYVVVGLGGQFMGEAGEEFKLEAGDLVIAKTELDGEGEGSISSSSFVLVQKNMGDAIGQADLFAVENSLQGDIAAESSARQAADSAEQSARIAADNAATTDRAAIRSEFAAADTALQSAIDAVQADVDANESASDAADATLQSNIDAEEAAREAADTTLQSNIDAEEAAREAADTTLQSNIDAVQADVDANEAASDAADAALQSAIDAVQADVDSNEAASDAADAALQSAIDAEEAAREAADTTLQSNIDAEEAAREAADTTLQSNIDAVQADVDANEAASDAADATLQSNIDAVQADVDANEAASDAADATLQSNIDAEEAAREAADTALQSNIDTVAQDLADYETSNDAALAQEVSDRIAADNAIRTDMAADIATALAQARASEMTYRGGIDASDSTCLDGLTVAVGDMWTVTTEGSVFGEVLSIGDMVIAEVDGASLSDLDEFTLVQKNFDLSEYSTTAEVDASIAAVQSDVDANEAASDAADAALQSAIDAVQADVDANESASDAADAALQSAIDAVQADVDANESDSDAADAALQSAIDAEEAAREAADTTLQSNIDSVQADVDANEAASDAADATLQSNIDAVQADVDANEAASDAADATLQSNIDAVQADVDANEAASDAADATLQSNIDTVAANLASEISTTDTEISNINSSFSGLQTHMNNTFTSVETAFADVIDFVGKHHVEFVGPTSTETVHDGVFVQSTDSGGALIPDQYEVDMPFGIEPSGVSSAMVYIVTEDDNGVDLYTQELVPVSFQFLDGKWKCVVAMSNGFTSDFKVMLHGEPTLMSDPVFSQSYDSFGSYYGGSSSGSGGGGFSGGGSSGGGMSTFKAPIQNPSSMFGMFGLSVGDMISINAYMEDSMGGQTPLDSAEYSTLELWGQTNDTYTDVQIMVIGSTPDGVTTNFQEATPATRGDGTPFDPTEYNSFHVRGIKVAGGYDMGDAFYAQSLYGYLFRGGSGSSAVNNGQQLGNDPSTDHNYIMGDEWVILELDQYYSSTDIALAGGYDYELREVDSSGNILNVLVSGQQLPDPSTGDVGPGVDSYQFPVGWSWGTVAGEVKKIELVAKVGSHEVVLKSISNPTSP